MSRRLIIVTVLAITLLSGLFWSRLYLKGQQYTGDEPHYLLMTDSLLRDGDFNLKNQYQERRYVSFYRNISPDQIALEPHVPNAQQSGQEWYSIHGAGLPVVLAPFLAAAGTKGVGLAMLLVSVLISWLAFRWVEQATGSATAAVVSVLLMVVTVSWLDLADAIFPDLPIAAVLLGGFLLLERPRPGRWTWIVLGLLLGVGLWIHVKTMLVLITLGGFAVYKVSRLSKRRTADLLALLAPWLGLWALFIFKLHEWYGVWLPTQMYGGQVVAPLFTLSPLKTIPAMLFDSAKGLLPSAPALVLLLPGLALWWKAKQYQLLRVLAVIGPTFLLSTTFYEWGGIGTAPTGRYLLEFVPLLLPALGFVLLYLRRPAVFGGVVAIAILQFWLTATHLVNNPSWTNAPQRNPDFVTIEQKTGWPVERLLPRVDQNAEPLSARSRYLLVLYSVLAAGLIYGGTRLGRRPVKQPARRRRR